MKHLLCILLLIGLCVSAAFPQYSEQVVMSANTIIPSTPEFGPAGAASAASSWIINGPTDVLTPLSLFICPDSVAGYATTDDSIKVEVIYRTANTSTHAYPANYTTQVLFYRDLALGSVPSDTCYWVSWTPPPHYARRYRVSVDDTVAVSLIEGKMPEEFHNPWRP